MSTTPSTTSVILNKFSIPFYLVLIVAGLAGNYFNFPIFFNVDFLFGGIFAMLALQFFGLGRGILAAAIISSITYFLWNHPYAAILRIAEVAAVGLLIKRRQIGLLQADILYWLIVGMPVAYVFYHFAMHLPSDNTSFVITKQAINCIATTQAARLIFIGYALWSHSALISYREIVYNLLAFFVLCPALIILAVESRSDFNETDLRIRTSLIQDNQSMAQRLETWVANRKAPIVHLAKVAATLSPKQMQPRLEQAHQSDLNFKTVCLLNKDATTTAFSPLIDELGQSTIGKSYADRPYLPMFKRTLKPMLTEVAMSKVGIPRPHVRIIAPVVIRGEYAGYVSGLLKLEQVQEFLDKSVTPHSSLYTLIDKNSNVIMTNRTDQKVMTPFVRGKGVLKRLDAGINQWLPAVPPNTPLFERWRKSFYIAEAPIGNLAEWKLILEQPVAPFQKTLYSHYAKKLYLLFLMMLGAMALAEFFSRRIVATLGKLRTLTFDLPVRMVKDGQEIIWPESGIKETNHLINNFREMANTLSVQYKEILLVNESLEQRVVDRTKTLRESEEKFRSFFESATDGISLFTTQGVLVSHNAAFAGMHGYTPQEMHLMELKDLDTPETARLAPERVRKLLTEKTMTFEVEHYHKDGHIFPLEVAANLISIGDEKYFLGFHRDISARKQMEKEIIRSLQEKEVLLKEIHHRVKNNMQVIYSLLNLQANGIADSSIRTMFEESRNRIASMALIHENLYQSTDLARIDFRKYLENLVQNIAATYCRPEVHICLEMDPLALDVNVGIPCGLIVNELVSNSFKYAFPEGQKGIITLGINRNRDDGYLLSVSDNGIGFPEDLDFRKTRSLGMQLVTILAGQIHGTIELTTTKGTLFNITFPGQDGMQ